MTSYFDSPGKFSAKGNMIEEFKESDIKKPR